jgi:selenide,water dikinase
MGGAPMMAIAILGWPIDKLAPEVAQQVIEGGRDVCREAGIALAGGHSIDSPEPIFGLAVTGRVGLEQLKRNDSGQAGDLLYLTKPLGVGILTTAQKQKKLKPEHEHIAIDNMCQLNKLGQDFAKLPYVNAMTDVTGFGLGGHLVEMCQGAGLSATIQYDQLPRLAHAEDYLNQGCIPGGTNRNFQSYGKQLCLRDENQRLLICDPQTSGGLLVSVDPANKAEFEQQFAQSVTLIGRFDLTRSEKAVNVR